MSTNMTDPVCLEGIRVFGGEETPHFSAHLFSRGKKIGLVRNEGTGGPCIFVWEHPFSRQWAEEKFLPLMQKYAKLTAPEFSELFDACPHEALSFLVLDKLDRAIHPNEKDVPW